MATPSTNGECRDQHGRFATGNAGGPGNPLGGKVAKLRAALVEAVSEDDIRAVAATLVSLAKGGDPQAIKELLNRALGRPLEHDILARIEALEQNTEVHHAINQRQIAET
ncbi:MAG: hypothetical protein IT440_13460 [Phycisphaeraceae bacterium]|nr:hypothetical protein [Phycisphaeraceae bacterium]